MITHDSNWVVDAPRDEVWLALHTPAQDDRRATTVANPRVIQHNNVRIEIVAEGDEHGQGLVRRCWYAVPWYFGGKARSWEIVSEVKPPEYQRYDVLFCTPPDAVAAGSGWRIWATGAPAFIFTKSFIWSGAGWPRWSSAGSTASFRRTTTRTCRA
jgi:hypothetical protein